MIIHWRQRRSRSESADRGIFRWSRVPFGTAAVTYTGTSSKTIAPFTQVASGRLQITGAANELIDAFTSSNGAGVIGRRIVRRGRMRLYAWQEEAPSPDIPAIGIEETGATEADDDDNDRVADETVEKFSRRLDAVEKNFRDRLRKAERLKDEEKRRKRIRQLAETARAESEAALREATREAETAERRSMAIQAEIARQEIEEEEEEAIRKLILKLAMEWN